MDIQELKKKKMKLEKEILRLIFEYERDTGTEVTKINVEKHGFFRGDRLQTVEVETRL
jgi:hypothetical protein